MGKSDMGLNLFWRVYITAAAYGIYIQHVVEMKMLLKLQRLEAMACIG